MPTIRQLPTSVVNKIAAGEVIERPASVVKELMENSVDAGATRVDVTIEHGGSELVRIADNGCGIAEDQLALSVASHATSKILDADDLFHVGTLGFRGEALASIAEVSQFRLRSRIPESDAAAEMYINGGQLVEVTPCGAAVGTTIEVRNLFFNTPVRKKFLRTTQTEFGHLSEAFTRIALAFPHVHFTLKHGARQIYDLPPSDNWRERLAAFFGDEIATHLIPIDNADDTIRLSGYVADPKFNRGNNKMQFLFLNGRHIRDRALQHALSEAYRGLLLTGRYPIAFLRLQMPPEMVDVNVHPTKLEVRFQDSGRIYSQLLGTLRTKFLSTDLTATYKPVDSDELHGNNRHGAASGGGNINGHDVETAARMREELVAWAKGQLPADDEDLRERRSVQESLDLDFRSQRHPPLELSRFDRDALAAASSRSNGQPGEGARLDAPHETPPQPTPGRALQLHRRYLVTETPEGMVVIDQHALHERILYEEFREKALAGRLETQNLLAPETMHLSPSEFSAVMQAQEPLAQLGFQVESFGGDTILISSYPAILDRRKPSETLREIIDHLVGDGKRPDRRDLLDELLHMMSCKAAVKAGDRLSAEEIDALLELRHLCQDAHHCPHGRPTSLVFTKEELDRRFERI
ncbi:DNA mismatch repair endonuclease MutL [Blastopirellula marina]|uniref:DNA mismatch repair protein MutL n=1 Tax=Blastopirellula marina DSM 3645 TaxID=314230 RepID=A4A186_9BACT|nr:DNA mismatch repair endonuclease MutL [Blastopirellula marina]EAQ77438.1 DNA mismatch repair protein [Blastopirellula marina DSM 3645]